MKFMKILKKLAVFLLKYLEDKYFHDNIVYCNSKLNFTSFGATKGSKIHYDNYIYFKV